MSDKIIRAGVGDMEMPEFETTAFTAAPPLAEATVAIVTTAGLQRPGEDGWGQADQSFRLFNKDEHNLITSHLSPNFDRTGLTADLNVAYPLDRLEEMKAEGLIKEVAPRHASFMGAQQDMLSTIRQDSGPALAKELKDDGVDVVILTPV